MVDLYNEARATTDPATRNSLYAQLEEYAVQDCPVIPIYQGSAWAVSKTDVEGVILDISQLWRNWHIIPEFPVNLLAILLTLTIVVLLANKILKPKTVQTKTRPTHWEQ